MIGHLETLNRQLFLLLNATPETPGAVLSVAKMIASGLIVYVPLLLAFLWLWGNDQQRNASLRAAVALIIGLVANILIGKLWYHPRPLALNLGHTYLFHPLSASFPSDHTTAFAVVGFALLGGGMRVWGGVTLIAGALVGWARIFLGVHFPFDILGAFVVSYLVCQGVSYIWPRVGNTLMAVSMRIYGSVMAPLIGRGWIRR
ncbi:MAG: phosphatase PAP2 family protein [Proteobacteria bacterium]|nr:phosphatase PAP2 family protein [Pseudomonadota bacterium]